MTRFDPLATASAISSRSFFMPKEADLPDYGPGGLVQAATASINTYVEAWLAGEGSALRSDLERIVGWADDAAEADLAYGDDPLMFAVPLRRARAVGHWLLNGIVEPDLWRQSGTLAERLWQRERDGRPLLCPAYDVLLDYALAGDAGAITHIGSTFPTADDPIASALIGAFAEPDGPQRAQILGQILWRELRDWLGHLPNINIAAWLALSFSATGSNRVPPARVPRLLYVLVPSLPLPPVFSSAPSPPDEPAVISGGNLSFVRVAALLPALGVPRDPDRDAQGDIPLFASWTRAPTLDLEVDWHSPPGQQPRLEISGSTADRLAGALMEIFGAETATASEAELARLLTVPATARHSSNAQIRWETLATLLRAPEADALIVRALIAAGLKDTDWRVRMLAVWGVGALRVRGLAEGAKSASLPSLQVKGISQVDRATLLGLRDAAWLRASDASPERPTNPWAGPGGARRIEFVERMLRMFDKPDAQPSDRHAALIAALRRDPATDRTNFPHGWSHWSR